MDWMKKTEKRLTDPPVQKRLPSTEANMKADGVLIYLPTALPNASAHGATAGTDAVCATYSGCLLE
jgi:hypothetical protein